MKKYIFIIIGLGILGIAIYTVSSYNASKTKEETATQTQTNSSETYDQAMDFTLVDLEGNEVSLSDYKGKKIFLNFWATWCPPCKAEMPDIEKLYQETKDSNLVILSVEIGEPRETVSSFIEEKGFQFKVLLDSDQRVSTDYGIVSIPTSYFIDEDGYIIAKRVGGMNFEEMKGYITSLGE